ncbi:hypothetical protein V6N12_038219 [Hibiscus sabdariffa]|uniref:Uncharacterized protein n=1 Tax=Hibiscus sabdariffa TaxID=183260 RepID=A0ABR2BX01_9ROSI
MVEAKLSSGREEEFVAYTFSIRAYKLLLEQISLFALSISCLLKTQMPALVNRKVNTDGLNKADLQNVYRRNPSIT